MSYSCTKRSADTTRRPGESGHGVVVSSSIVVSARLFYGILMHEAGEVDKVTAYSSTTVLAKWLWDPHALSGMQPPCPAYGPGVMEEGHTTDTTHVGTM